MISSDEIHMVSQKYEVPIIDTYMIALNTFGARSPLPFLRIRSYFRPKGSKKFYLMICLNTSPTPFYLDELKVYLNKEVIGKLEKLENDFSELCYFRKRNKVLVLNTNDRARCIGKCKFCGTGYLTPRINRKILKFDELLKWFEEIQNFARIKFSKLEEICLNTAIFKTERELADHLIAIYLAAKEFGFSGEIKYIGTQLRSKDVLLKISQTIPHFSYYFTLETLEHREFVDEKKDFHHQFHIEKLAKFLKYIKSFGFETSVLYILGLDSLPAISYGFQHLKNALTRFPVINLFQAYHPSHEKLRHPQAKHLKYFLKARIIFEKLFEDTNLKPKLWENYRGLWYTKFRGEKIGGQGLQTFIRGY